MGKNTSFHDAGAVLMVPTLAMLLAIAAAAVGTYLRAREDANALFDYQLKEMAASLTDAPFVALPPSAGSTGPTSDTLVVQIWDRNGVQLFMTTAERAPRPWRVAGG